MRVDKKFPLYIVNMWSGDKIYVAIRMNASQNSMALNADGVLSLHTKKHFVSFRQAIQVLKKFVPGLVRVRNSIYGEYGKQRKYLFIHKSQLLDPNEK